jgi:hypothetical protein
VFLELVAMPDESKVEQETHHLNTKSISDFVIKMTKRGHAPVNQDLPFPTSSQFLSRYLIYKATFTILGHALHQVTPTKWHKRRLSTA